MLFIHDLSKISFLEKDRVPETALCHVKIFFVGLSVEQWFWGVIEKIMERKILLYQIWRLIL